MTTTLPAHTSLEKKKFNLIQSHSEAMTIAIEGREIIDQYRLAIKT